MLSNASTIVCQSGESLRMFNWVEWLETTAKDVPIPLRLWKIWALILMFRLKQAHVELDQIAHAMPHDAPPSSRAHRERLYVSLASRRDDMLEVISLAQAWLERWRDAEPFHGAAVAVVWTLAQHLCFEDASRRRSMHIARQCAQDASSSYAHAWIAAVEAIVELDCGYV